MTENQKIIDFLNELKSAAPAPGGGAVAALAGAQGAALIMMVANLTVGKKKYEEYEDYVARLEKKLLNKPEVIIEEKAKIRKYDIKLRALPVRRGYA